MPIEFNSIYRENKLNISSFDNSIYWLGNSIYRVVNSIYRVLNSIYRVMNSIYRVMNSIYWVVNSIYRLLKSIYRVLDALHWVANSIYLVKKISKWDRLYNTCRPTYDNKGSLLFDKADHHLGHRYCRALQAKYLSSTSDILLETSVTGPMLDKMLWIYSNPQ